MFRLYVSLLLVILGFAAVVVPSWPTSAQDKRRQSVAPRGCTVDPIVANNADSGSGSLRKAVSDACSGSTITFAGTVASPISLTSGEITIAKNLTINGPGANLLTVMRSAADTPDFRIFKINSNNIVSISRLTIANGKASDSIGGGIWNELSTLNIRACTFMGNSAIHGGGINNNLGTLNVLDSTFNGNFSTTGSGGGILNQGTLTVTNSTFSGNSGGTSGGGGIATTSDTAIITNSTITGNSAGSGGGISTVFGGPVTLRNSIIALNTASSTCGGGCPDGSPDLFGTDFTSLGHNIVGKTSGATIVAQTGDKFDAASSPLNLGPLANNGGPTQTHALLNGSTALNAGNNALAVDANNVALINDQRGAGFPRVFGGTVDIGAFETQNTPPTIMAAAPLSRQQDSAATNSQIATVSDTESGAAGVTVTVTSANPSNGVTISNIANTGGNITADIGASCGASTANFTLQATDGSLTATATLTVNVTRETTPPMITCPGGITTFTDSGQFTATVNPGTPVATDNCALQSVTGVRSDGKPLNAPYPLGVTIITWTATDASGNKASCGQSIAIMVPSGQRHRP